MSGISEIAERLRMSAMSLESRHREREAGWIAARSQSHTRMARTPRTVTRSVSPRVMAKSVVVHSERDRERVPKEEEWERARGAALWDARDQALEVYRDIVHSSPKGCTLAAFTQKLASCRIDLEASTIEGIFYKADADSDGLLSSSEFVAMQGTYPTLISCLYNRINRRAQDRAASELLTANRAKLSALSEEDARHASSIDDKRQDLTSRVASLKDKQAAASNSEAKLRGVKKTLEALSEECENKSAEHHSLRAGYSRCKQGAAQCQDEIKDAVQHKEYAVRQLKTHEAKEAAAAQRLKELLALVAEQEQEVQRHKARTQRSYKEVEQAQRSHEALCKEAEQYDAEVKKAEVALAKTAEDLEHVTKRKEKFEEEAERCSREVTDKANERDSAARQVEELSRKVEELEAERRAGRTSTQQRVREQEDAIQRLEAEIENTRAKHLKLEKEEENPVLLMEIKLRRQRDDLEEEEEKLKSHRHELSKISAAYDPLDDLLSPRHVSPRGARSTTGLSYTPSDLSSSPSHMGRQG
eukprot:TRINITY_DN9611_c0_g1_i1.p1 TRINITY_DN9611_c0_g1~~TRINITY_DN9611_c0_g1_i1.p1  ORF type:complete len:530 (+),score=147.62 TRINITY_DN9611_c0_g1_i1:739-2328(+)